MISIDRLAMEIAGKTTVQARKTLERHGFSLAESSEIVASHWIGLTSNINPDWQSIAETIKSTMETSVRIGDRLDMNIS